MGSGGTVRLPSANRYITEMNRVWLGMFVVEENGRKAAVKWRGKDMYGMKYLNSTYSISKEHSWKIAIFPQAIPLILSPGWSWVSAVIDKSTGT